MAEGNGKGGKDHVSLKTRLLAGAGTLALAGSMIGVAAPAAHAQVTPVGGCGGAIILATFYDSTGAVLKPLTDVTAIGTTAKTKLLKDITTKTAIGGDCSSAVRPGDPIHPAGGLVSPLTPKAAAAKLVGNASCAPAADDPAAAAAWPLNGKITYTMTQLNDLAKPYQIQADISVLGFDPVQADVVNLAFIVLKGAAVGANVSGGIWFDPVALLPKCDPGLPGAYNTGYGLNIAPAAGCQDGVPGNAAIDMVMSGGGGATDTSLLGSVAPGLI